jgi:hypothetical protein
MGDKSLSKLPNFMPAHHFVTVGPPNICDKSWKSDAATEEIKNNN